MANQEMERALVFAGYEAMHASGDGGHNGKHATEVFNAAQPPCGVTCRSFANRAPVGHDLAKTPGARAQGRACASLLVTHGHCGRSAWRHILEDRLELLQMRVQAE